jgi:chromosomal replication initiator protein
MELVASQLEQLVEPRSSGFAGQDGIKAGRGLQFRELLVQQIGEERLSLWFGHAARWEFDHNVLSITLENQFMVECVRSFCWDELKSVIAELDGPTISIQLLHDPKLAQPIPVAAVVAPPSQTNPSKKLPVARPMPSPTIPIESCRVVVASSQHNSKSSPKIEHDWWAEFVQGSASRLATTAIDMILERPGTISPILIHGPCGSGKSHLAKAAAQQLRRRCGFRRTILMTAEQFTIDYTESARGAGFASFRKKYRDVDAFVLDDLQFCLGKSATLSELRNTLDNLIRDRKQVIFVSDRSLNELAGLGSDLVARIAGGMSCGMEPLDAETRLALLKRLLMKHELTLSPSTVESLADSAGGDGRALYGIVFRLLAEQRRLDRPLSHDEALGASLDLIRASQPVIRLSDIERVVCENFRLEPKSLQTKGKTKFVSGPRMLAMFLARKHTRAAYSEIGEYFGNRQHSTVISAQKKVAHWLESNGAVPQGTGNVAVREVLRRLEASLQVG